MSLFERDTEIYRDRNALREDYQPEELVGRDEELRTFQAALWLVINGRQPDSIFPYGKTGTGETTTSRYLPGHLCEDVNRHDDIHLTVVFPNRSGLTSSYQIAARLINESRSESNQISTADYPPGSVYKMLWQELDDRGGTIVIALGEIDHANDSSILYQLPRARASGNLDTAKVGLIGTSNNFSFCDDLSPKVKSPLCEQETRFPAYNAKSLRAILEQRAKMAFREDALSDEVIPLYAAYGARDAGGTRQSIDLLMKANDLARDDDVDRVGEEHVKRDRRVLECGCIKEGIGGLTKHGHLVPYSFLMLELEDETPIRSCDVRPRYTRLTKLANRDPLVPRWMCDHLSELVILDVISVTERSEGRRGGAYRRYALDMDVGLIVSAIRDTVELAGIHEAVKPFLDGDKTNMSDDFIEQ